ncbi:MAG TPA: BTAD domain-containing putative transcriptional regulator, partial [Herpetosiphonaceae bacterium]
MSIADSDLLDPARQQAAPVQVRLLGAPSVLLGGQAAPLVRRQLRALFYRMAVAPAPLARDHLCFLLWPDDADQAARRKLAVLLNLLRRGLAPHDPILALEDTIQLAPAGVWVDTWAFAAGVRAATATRQLGPLAAAADLARGPLLDGFALADSAEYERWLMDERQHWERQVGAALAGLIDGATALGDYAQAIAAAERSLALDPLAEDIHRRLIWLYGADGNRAAALRQFERCERILREELGVGALPETQAVAAAIRDQAAPVQRQRATAAGTWIVEAPGFAGMLAVKPLYGRDRELALVSGLLADDATRLLTLSGPGGSGKTHLAQAIAAAASFPDGVAWVSLAALRTPDLLLAAICHACGIADSGAAAPGTTMALHLHAVLRSQRMLLVLDNAEHVRAAAGLIADLVLAAPQLRVLITSRVALNLPGEQVVPVPPLPVPPLGALPPLAELAAQPAMALLIQAVRSRQPAFELSAATAADLAAICARLDGLPLALELAA